MPKIAFQISVHARHCMQNKKGGRAHSWESFTLYMKSLPKSTTVLGVVLGNTVDTQVYRDTNMYCMKYQDYTYQLSTSWLYKVALYN